MAQSYDKYELDNDNGKAFRLALNDILEASATQNSGPNSPNTSNTSYPYQVWVDETNDIVKIRDAATAGSWYSLYSVDSDGKPTGAVAYGNYTIATNDTAGTGGTTAITVDTSQRVGIATGSPANDLDVLKTASGSTTTARIGATAASGANNATLILNNGGTGDATLRFDYESSTDRASIGVSASNQELTFSTAGSTAATIDSSGNVGIGSTNPYNNPGYASMTLDDTSGGQIRWRTGGTEQGLIYNDGSNFVIYSFGSTPMKFFTNGSERMQIQSDGTILNYGAVYFNYGTSYSFPISYSSGVGAIIFGNPNTAAYVIYSNSSSTAGVLLNTNATAWTSYTSESRLKNILGDVDSDQAWDLVRDIELVRYYYKDQDDKTGVSYAGPMADWLGVQDPELLIDTGRTDDEGPIHTFNQALLDVKALAALSAALKRIETLEAKVAALESA